MDAVELEIRITGTSGNKYLASVERSPAGPGGSIDFELPEVLPSGLAAGGWRNVRRRSEVSDSSALNLLLEQGRWLFKQVFRDGILLAFSGAFELSRQNRCWFRLQLAFDKAPESVAWPWEALVGPDGSPLALLPDVSIERRLFKAPSAEKPRPLREGKRRGLIAGASPKDLDPLDLESEISWIRKALPTASFKLKTTKDASRKILDRLLRDGDGFDFVHFFGHGDFEDREGGLWLENASGAAERLNSRELVAFMRGPVPFVFLNVCHGARSAENPFAGLADALLRSGAGAVVAMRREVRDEGAVQLARNFYRRVARGETLARALAEARRDEVDSGDWALPVLYLAGDDFSLVAKPVDSGLPAVATLTEPPSVGDSSAPASLPKHRLLAALTLISLLAVLSLAAAYVLPTLARRQEVEPRQSLGELPGKPSGQPAVIEIAAEPKSSPPAAAAVVPPPSKSAPAPPPAPPAEPRCPSPIGFDFHFILVKKGTFLQGEDKGEDDFRPRHQVTLSEDFCLNRDETTREQWAKVMGLPAPGPAETRLPIVSITWDEVQAFVRILNERDKSHPYRLPSEAEWERAARAGSTTLFSFGDDDKLLPQYGNCVSRKGVLKPVGRFAPNPWGFRDMHGNVWEWAADHWSSYGPEPATDPLGRNVNASHVRRGGAYDSRPDNCWSAARRNLGHDRMKTVGFRLARDPAR